MKTNLFFILTSLFSIAAFAKKPLILSNLDQEMEFQEYLSQRPDFTSWQDGLKRKIMFNENQESSLFQLSESFPIDPLKGLEAIEEQSRKPLSRLSLEFLNDFSNTMLEKKFPPNVLGSLEKLACKTGGLLKRKQLVKCPHLNVIEVNDNLKKIDTKSLYVESLPFDEVSFSIDLNQKYNWSLFYHNKIPYTFYGTFEELLSQKTSTELLVEGSCQKFSLNSQIQEPAAVFFSPDCVRDGFLRQDEITWSKKHRNFLVSAGALVLMGSVLYLSGKALHFKITY